MKEFRRDGSLKRGDGSVLYDDRLHLILGAHPGLGGVLAGLTDIAKRGAEAEGIKFSQAVATPHGTDGVVELSVYVAGVQSVLIADEFQKIYDEQRANFASKLPLVLQPLPNLVHVKIFHIAE